MELLSLGFLIPIFDWGLTEGNRHGGEKEDG
jgi:hypothetical protein